MKKRRESVHEAHDRHHLDDAQYELGLAVALDAEQVHHHHHAEHDRNPHGIRHASVPIIHYNAPTNSLERQHDKPHERIIPAHCEPPRRIQKARRERRERPRDGERHRQLAQRVHGAVQHQPDEREGD